MKTLNLDELAPNDRSVTIKGNSYPVCEMTVEGFLEFSQMSEGLEKKAAQPGGLTVRDHIESMVATIRLALPTAPKEVLAALSIPQLTTLVKFLNGELSDQQAPAAAATKEDAATPKS